jgi:ABC-2 type transport system permease protein
LAGVAVIVGLGIAFTATLDVSHCADPCTKDTTKLSLTGVRVGQIAVVLLAVLAVTTEYGTGTIQPTLASVPRRGVVLLAKLTVVVGTVLVAGAVSVVGSLLAARASLPGTGFTPANGFPYPSLTDDHTLRAAAGTVLYLGLIAALCVGVAFIVRDSAGALTTVLALLYLFPILSAIVSKPAWERHLEQLSPMDAGLAVQATRGLADAPIGPWAGLGVLAAYAATAVVVGATVFRVRDG